MWRTSLSEQLLQPSLFQRFVGANRDAIAPATNLLNGEPMTGGRLAHLNLELGFRCDCVGQLRFFSAESVKGGGFLDRLGRHFSRVRNARGTRKADCARPKALQRAQPITFAFCSSQV